MKNNLGIVALLLSSAAITHASPIDLTGQGWVTYGDANSYSLPLSGLEVLAGPGQINMFTKLGLQAVGVLDNPQPDMDDAFLTPSANNVHGFRMDTTNEPTDTGSWDRDGWWDTSLSALDAETNLAQNSAVFFFANNETGGEANDNLAAWARFELTKISTNELLGQFDLTNDPDHNGQGYGPPPAGGGVPLGDPTDYTSNGAEPFVSDFVMSGGNVCVNSSGLLVDCGDPDVVTNAEHNLGGDRAAYAIVLPELDELIAGLVDANLDLSDYALHVNFRLGCGPELTQAGGAFPTIQQGSNTLCDPNYALNGGAEKVFMGTQLRPGVSVPEPATLAIFTIGLLTLGYFRRVAA